MIVALMMMVQCYAALHQQARCDPYRVYDNAGECKKLAAQWTKADRKALTVTGLPAIVEYKCMPIE